VVTESLYGVTTTPATRQAMTAANTGNRQRRGPAA
jgi:hypothetical protein